jgi:hypothetical protein
MLPTGTYTAADAEICGVTRPAILRAVEAHARDSRFTDDLTVLVRKRAACAPDASAPKA